MYLLQVTSKQVAGRKEIILWAKIMIQFQFSILFVVQLVELSV